MARPENFETRCLDRLKITAEICAEMKKAFEESFAVCFEINREKKKTAAAGSVLKRRILSEIPSAVIVPTDLCVMKTEPFVKRDQLLVILKKDDEEAAEFMKLLEESGLLGDDTSVRIEQNTEKESALLMQILSESEIVDNVYMIFREKKNNVKRCANIIFGSDKPAIVNKANLLIDGDKLLMTVRVQTRKDCTVAETEGE